MPANLLASLMRGPTSKRSTADMTGVRRRLVVRRRGRGERATIASIQAQDDVRAGRAPPRRPGGGARASFRSGGYEKGPGRYD